MTNGHELPHAVGAHKAGLVGTIEKFRGPGQALCASLALKTNDTSVVWLSAAKLQVNVAAA